MLLKGALKALKKNKYSNTIITVPGMGGSVGLDLQVITQSWIDELLLNVGLAYLISQLDDFPYVIYGRFILGMIDFMFKSS